MELAERGICGGSIGPCGVDSTSGGNNGGGGGIACGSASIRNISNNNNNVDTVVTSLTHPQQFGATGMKSAARPHLHPQRRCSPSGDAVQQQMTTAGTNGVGAAASTPMTTNPPPSSLSNITTRGGGADWSGGVAATNRLHDERSTSGGPSPAGHMPSDVRQQQQQQQQQQRCAACGREIADRFLLHAIDRYWHTECLRCSACQAPLAELGSTCFTRAGMTLCRSDYIRLFGLTGTCSACHQSIPPNEFVMKTQDSAVYHVTCFACVTCHGRLVPGDRYGIVHGRLVCEQDYVKAVKNQLQLQHDSTPSTGPPLAAGGATAPTQLRVQNHKVC